MKLIWMRAGALGVAVGTLGLLMVQAGLSSCGSATPQAEPGGSKVEPPITTKASEPPSAEPSGEDPLAPPQESPHYMPATKSGSILHRRHAPAQQQAAPPGKGE